MHPAPSDKPIPAPASPPLARGRSFTRRVAGLAGVACLAAALLACHGSRQGTGEAPRALIPERAVIASPRATPRPPYRFSPADERFLDEVQRAAFDFFWLDAAPGAGMVLDRTSAPIVSVAGVGFQLSSLVVGAERGWVSPEQAAGSALAILRALEANPDNRKEGLFYHYLDGQTAGPSRAGYEHIVSTIDSALLFAGILTAAAHFGGDVKEVGDRLFAEANWRFFTADERSEPFARGTVSLGWKPLDPDRPGGDGDQLPFHWVDSGDEHRLVTFLAACAPRPEHRVDAAVYYRLRRQLGDAGDGRPVVWFPWSGALFTAFFAHGWIDYAGLGPDDPAAHGVPRRPRVDWWENSRRLVNMHRAKALENPLRLPGFGKDAWGLGASDAAAGYQVAHLYPRALEMVGAIPEADFPTAAAHDDWGDGTIAPYNAGASILFEPRAAVAALRHYRALKGPDGTPLIWRDPAAGGRGFLDAFNPGTGWVASDYVAIDQGPLLLAIENARSGLLWRTFHSHPAVRAGTERLGLTPRRHTPAEPRPAARPSTSGPPRGRLGPSCPRTAMHARVESADAGVTQW